MTELWHRFKSSGALDERNQLLLHYTSLVRYVATRVASSLPPTVDKEDLVSYGTIGLIDAIEKYDLSKGTKFETYAIARIKGSIIDELRKMDWVPRSIRSKARDIERVYVEMEAELGRPPEEREVAERLGLTVPDLWLLLSQTAIVSVTALDESEADDERQSVSEMLQDPTSNPEDVVDAEQIVELLADAVDGMSERSKTILVLYYLEEMTLEEIGHVLGVTESRVCQLQSKVLQSLRDSFAGGGFVAA